MQRACVIPKQKSDYFDPLEPVQNRLYKSLKLWSMHADLEESFGTFEVIYLISFNDITLYSSNSSHILKIRLKYRRVLYLLL